MPPKLESSANSLSPLPFNNEQSPPSPTAIGSATRRNRVQTACTACKKRKTKCDGQVPACRACSDRGAECIYELDNDRRRREAWMRDMEHLRELQKSSQAVFTAIKQHDNDDVYKIVEAIRLHSSIHEVADFVKNGLSKSSTSAISQFKRENTFSTFDTPMNLTSSSTSEGASPKHSEFGSSRVELNLDVHNVVDIQHLSLVSKPWTTVTDDSEIISHLIMLYFAWDRPFSYLVNKECFLEDMMSGSLSAYFCSPLLVNAILALSCQYSDRENVCTRLDKPGSRGDSFMDEARALFYQERGRARLTTAQALGIMSIRELALGRDTIGWQYACLCFQMFLDLGFHNQKIHRHDTLNTRQLNGTCVGAWGIYCLEKLYFFILHRVPQLPRPSLPMPSATSDSEDELWYPYPLVRQTTHIKLHLLFETHCALSTVLHDICTVIYSTDQFTSLSTLSDLYDEIMDWRNKLPRVLEIDKNSCPYNSLLHMYFHSMVIALLQPNMTTSRTYGHDPPMTARQQCIVSATTITKYIWHYRANFTLLRIVSFAFHPIFLAALTHLTNLSQTECQKGFVQCVTVLSDLSKKWPICRFLLYVLECISRQEVQHELPRNTLETLEMFTPNLSELEIQEGTSIYPITTNMLDASNEKLDQMPEYLGLSDFISQSLQSSYKWGMPGSKRQKMQA